MQYIIKYYLVDRIVYMAEKNNEDTMTNENYTTAITTIDQSDIDKIHTMQNLIKDYDPSQEENLELTEDLKNKIKFENKRIFEGIETLEEEIKIMGKYTQYRVNELTKVMHTMIVKLGQLGYKVSAINKIITYFFGPDAISLRHMYRLLGLDLSKPNKTKDRVVQLDKTHLKEVKEPEPNKDAEIKKDSPLATADTTTDEEKKEIEQDATNIKQAEENQPYVDSPVTGPSLGVYEESELVRKLQKALVEEKNKVKTLNEQMANFDIDEDGSPYILVNLLDNQSKFERAFKIGCRYFKLKWDKNGKPRELAFIK